METKKQTLLIVDDVPDNIRLLSQVLRSDYAIRVATDGYKALASAQKDPQPDLILLDVIMPTLDGYKVAQMLKNDDHTKDIPIIFITAKDTDKDEVRGFELGAVDYITKPFNPLVVKARVNTHAELKRLRDHLEKSMFIDVLTNLPNRRKFDEYYDMMWHLAKREATPLTVIMIDVDHFKLYNDNYGHYNGDLYLKQIAQVLSQSIKRKVDLVSRYGGEEFICVLPNTSLAEAKALAESMRLAVLSLEIDHAFSPVYHAVSLSFGLASWVPKEDDQPLDLVKSADQALYMAKEQGRNRVCVMTK